MKLYYNEVPSGHYTATFYIESSTNLADACEGVAIGQTIGNPTVRIPKWETEDLVEKYSAKIISFKSYHSNESHLYDRSGKTSNQFG